jgi:hypothetical protein
MPMKKLTKNQQNNLISQAMSLLGSKTSDKKKKSSAVNGNKGGRPRKVIDYIA